MGAMYVLFLKDDEWIKAFRDVAERKKPWGYNPTVLITT